jgi:hypothetical protein
VNRLLIVPSGTISNQRKGACTTRVNSWRKSDRDADMDAAIPNISFRRVVLAVAELMIA